MDGHFAMLYSNLLIFSFFIVLVSASNITTAAPFPLVLKLIHPTKILAYYNPDVTLVEQVQRATDSSMARFAYLKSKYIQTSKMDVIQARPTTDFFGFFVNFSIGEPPVSQMVIMDSGSDLLWVQCLPCIHCVSQPNPYFDPSKSSTYSKVLIYTPNCKVPQSFGPTTGNPCSYTTNYADNSSTKGEIGKEKITFPTSDDGLVAIPNLIFGCGHENYGVNLKNGVLGLDASPVSLVSQLGSKFSYCLGNLSNPNYEHNQLVIGEGAIFEGDTTPIEIQRDLYYLTLEGITVGDTKLDIDPNIFKLSPEGDGGVIIDSGTFLTFLARSAYNALAAQVESIMSREIIPKVTIRPGELCYKGIMTRDLEAFPVVRFQFAGALVELDYEGIFFQYSTDIFCLAVTPVDDYELNLIGIRFQQYFNVGYDLTKKTIYFQRIDCELLET